VPPIGPGAMPLTRTPNSPHSTARLRVRLSTAALAADACAWRTQQRCSKAGRQERKLAPSRAPGLTVPDQVRQHPGTSQQIHSSGVDT